MGTNPIILLAEDHDDTRGVYSLILRHFGFEVEEATNGVEAVEIARETKPSLVLMDIGLPGLDGWEASRMLKSAPATASIPLIAFSGRIISTADLGAAATFDGFILKPISPLELVRRVQAYLGLLSPRRSDGHGVRRVEPRRGGPSEIAI
jgi:CheY-like chemotaxis protein